MNERHALAVRMRNEGNTVAQIGQALGVSRERVHQVLRLVKQRQAEEARQDTEPFLTLNPRVRRHLLPLFPGEHPKPSELREMMRSGLLKKIPNLGKLSLHQIETWLQSQGV